MPQAARHRWRQTLAELPSHQTDLPAVVALMSDEAGQDVPDVERQVAPDVGRRTWKPESGSPGARCRPCRAIMHGNEHHTNQIHQEIRPQLAPHKVEQEGKADREEQQDRSGLASAR